MSHLSLGEGPAPGHQNSYAPVPAPAEGQATAVTPDQEWWAKVLMGAAVGMFLWMAFGAPGTSGPEGEDDEGEDDEFLFEAMADES